VIPELITLTSFSDATGHILHVCLSRLLTQFKITSFAPFCLLHLPCKTLLSHIVGTRDMGRTQRLALRPIRCVALMEFTLSWICETPQHSVMVSGVQGA
jgi:hypothetical protein